MSSRIHVKLADDELEQLAKGGPEFGPRLSKLLDEELRDFDQELNDELGGGMVAMERAIIKTYLYRRITNKRLDDHEQRKIDVMNEVLAPS